MCDYTIQENETKYLRDCNMLKASELGMTFKNIKPGLIFHDSDEWSGYEFARRSKRVTGKGVSSSTPSHIRWSIRGANWRAGYMKGIHDNAIDNDEEARIKVRKRQGCWG